MTTYIKTAYNFLSQPRTALASAAIAAGSYLLGAFTTSKVAAVIAATSAALSLYSRYSSAPAPSPAAARPAQTKKHGDTHNQLARNAGTSPAAGSIQVTTLHPHDEIVRGHYNQYSVMHRLFPSKYKEHDLGIAACMSNAAAALVQMLKYGKDAFTKPKEIDDVLVSGSEEYEIASKVLQAGGGKEQGNEYSVDWSGLYENSSYRNTLLCNRSEFDPDSLETIQIEVTDNVGANPFSQRLKEFEDSIALGQSKGAILLLPPGAHAICINKDATGQSTIQFFDSHGGDDDPDRRAYVQRFKHIDDLVHFLRLKKPLLAGCGLMANVVQLHPCTLK